MHQLDLPIHPSKRHPLTGEPLRAVYVRSDGRVFWPVMGGAPEHDAAAQQAAADAAAKAAADAAAAAAAGGGGGGNATDDQGKDLGYPKDTRVAEMTADQQAAYWRHQSQKHEGRYKNLTGDRSFDDVKKDLDEITEIRKAKQTPSEQAVNEAREQGKAEALAEASSKAATAIFRASLTAQGHDEAEVNDFVANFNVNNFIADGEVDTEKLATFAKRFAKADTANEKRRRDFGGGDRNRTGGSAGSGGSVAQVIAERRAAREGKN